MKKIFIKKDSYFDSVSLMLINRELKTKLDVIDSVVAMGTVMNINLIKSMGFNISESSVITPNDLIIAVHGTNEEIVDSTINDTISNLTNKKTPTNNSTNIQTLSLTTALTNLPNANMAVISLPGTYAAREAHKALDLGLHVMLFSDNVSLEDEINLKNKGQKNGLLVMGPDCGTAIINGQPLCFANKVRNGPIGIIGASGTGIQEVSCLIDHLGSGISQAIGTGGRDLKNDQVGGITMLMSIEALAKDEKTKVIVVISKPPAVNVVKKVISALENAKKPAVVCFIGLNDNLDYTTRPNIHFTNNLEQAASIAVDLTNQAPVNNKIFNKMKNIQDIVRNEAKAINSYQKFIRGYYTGGTLADEALILLHKTIGNIYSNNQTDQNFILPNPNQSIGHTIIDLGDDVFTVGRPHPMIDPTTRIERMIEESKDNTIAVVMLDVVLGHGSHTDPAGSLLPAIITLKEAAYKRNGYLPVIASITGTKADLQNFDNQKAKLESVGCITLPSNYQAALFAIEIIKTIA